MSSYQRLPISSRELFAMYAMHVEHFFLFGQAVKLKNVPPALPSTLQVASRTGGTWSGNTSWSKAFGLVLPQKVPPCPGRLLVARVIGLQPYWPSPALVRYVLFFVTSVVWFTGINIHLRMQVDHFTAWLLGLLKWFPHAWVACIYEFSPTRRYIALGTKSGVYVLFK